MSQTRLHVRTNRTYKYSWNASNKSHSFPGYGQNKKEQRVSDGPIAAKRVTPILIAELNRVTINLHTIAICSYHNSQKSSIRYDDTFVE